METRLHRDLKGRFGNDAGGREEVRVGPFRVDAVAADGTLVEVQCGPLAALRDKLERLLPAHPIRVVKPVVVARRVIRRARTNGPDLSARLSPRRGRICDVFDDLIGLARLFPDPNLTIQVLAVEVDEVRVPRKRRPGYAVVDRSLRAVVADATLRAPEDLWDLLPAPFEVPFTTQDLAERLDSSLAFAQRVAYCLRMSGAADASGRAGRHRLYARRALALAFTP